MFFSGALLFACTCEFNISRIQERTDREILLNADSIASCSYSDLTTAEKELGEMSEYLAWKKFLFSLISELYDQHLTLSRYIYVLHNSFGLRFIRFFKFNGGWRYFSTKE